MNRPSLNVALSLVLSFTASVYGQAEVNGWGGMRGIRVDGELMPFQTGLRAVLNGGTETAITGSERVRRPQFIHKDNIQTCSGALLFRDGQTLPYTQVIQDTAPGQARVDLKFTASADLDLEGAYFFVHLPVDPYFTGTAQFDQHTPISLAAESQSTAKNIHLLSPRRQIQISLDQERQISIYPSKESPPRDIEVCFPISQGKLSKGQTIEAVFTLDATGEIDKTPAKTAIDTSHPGRAFDGIGGNFRLQNPIADPAIIQYNLENLRVAWGRIALPLNLWQPNEQIDPAQAANHGDLNPAVKAAMEMGATLAHRKIPTIISVWFAPAWALQEPTTAPSPGEKPRLRGRAIQPDKIDAVCNSIGAYLLYARRNYAFEPELFSFNESDLGIDVRQTPAEHAKMIKRLGQHLQKLGLKTRMLLGDTSDATPTTFINPAMEDPEAVKYIGAISFHSWRGGTDQQFTAWNRAADRLHVPLFVAEGGTDAEAWNYRAIFTEPWFALDEFNLYVRICAICQPRSILEWQLTSDYSILTNGHDGQPLQPTMRFWQLKQLGLTPAGARALKVSVDNPNISACAFGDVGGCTLHLVNNGPARPISITGLPSNLSQLQPYLTDATHGMKQLAPLPIEHGEAHFSINAMSFVTLTN